MSLNNEYFSWMCNLICGDDYGKRLAYKRLLNRLHDIEFTYIIPMDENRVQDGIDLRHRFGYDCRYSDAMVDNNLDLDPNSCSVLEMMVSLALSCEEHIMDDPTIGDRTGQWFWTMIESLGLDGMRDNKFDIDYVDMIVMSFLNRDYEPNGEGGLFTLKQCRRDLRNVDIWYQMMWYLTENFDFSI